MRTDSPVEITVPPRSSSLHLKRDGYSPATLDGSGLRSATMTLIDTGDTGKTVVYTDRELNRQLLEHYAPDTIVQTRLPFSIPPTNNPVPALSPVGQINVADKNWQITHPFSPSVAAGTGTTPPPKHGHLLQRLAARRLRALRLQRQSLRGEAQRLCTKMTNTTSTREVLDFVTVTANGR